MIGQPSSYGYPYYNIATSNPNMYGQQAYSAPQPVQSQIRSGGIVTVSGEDEARRYPVAPGYTVTMRDETKPYLYEKTMGFSQLDQPIFRKARLVFEDDTVSQQQENTSEKIQEPAPVYAELSQLEALRDTMSAELQKLHSMIDEIKTTHQSSNNEKGNRSK